MQPQTDTRAALPQRTVLNKRTRRGDCVAVCVCNMDSVYMCVCVCVRVSKAPKIMSFSFLCNTPSNKKKKNLMEFI